MSSDELAASGSQPIAVIEEVVPAKSRSTLSLRRLGAYGLLPALVLVLAIAAAYVKWQTGLVVNHHVAGAESVAAATDGTIALLSYQADTVEDDLVRARSHMTGTFLESYTTLTRDVVIPGAKQKHISAQATVPAAASVSATDDHAVVLLFVNQTVTVGDDPATSTASSVRLTLDKIHSRWLISGFDPV